MKVLWFCNTPANGDEFLNKQLKGTGGWLKSLDLALQDQVDLHISFYNDYKGYFKYRNAHYYPIYKSGSLITRYFDAIRSKIIYRKDVSLYKEIISIVKPDIIHIHGTENPFAYIHEITDIPIILSIQGNINICFHKFFSGIEMKYLNVSNGPIYSLFGYRQFKSHYKTFNRMKTREKEALGLLYKNIIGRTNWDRRICAVQSPSSSYYHNDEILRDEFYNNKWHSHDNENFIIFTTSGNTFYKGFETLCHSISLLIECGLKDFEWRVAGISNSDLIVKVVRKKLKSLFPKINLVLLGKLPEQDLIRNLLESDLYVMPSHIENSPNNLCEAMILGMPCIATFAGGTGSLLEDKNEGILIQDGDPWVMAGAIFECYKDKETYIKYGANARIRALKRHDKKKIVNDLLDIYSDVINKYSSIIKENKK